MLTNDTDPDVSDTHSVTGVATGSVTEATTNVGSPLSGQYGAITINSDGTYSYVVDNTNTDVQALRTAGDTLDDVFTYTIVDNDGAKSTTQITVRIEGANDNPNDLSTTGLNVDENAGFGTAVGSVSTSDVDSGETFTYQLTDSAGGRFAIDNSGNVTVNDPSGLDFEDASSHSIQVQVTDIAGGTYVETFTVTLNDLDEFDVSTPIDVDGNANAVNEGVVGATVGVTVSAIDADGTNNTVTYFLTDDSGGSFTIDQATGVVTTATALDFETQTIHTIEVEARSSDGSTSTETFTINVTDVNEAPVAIADSFTLNANTSVNLGVLSNDFDTDGDSLSSIIETPPSNGTLTQLADGSIVYTPNPGFFGTDSFTYRASDGSLESDVETVTLIVEAVTPPSNPEPEPQPEAEPEIVGPEVTEEKEEQSNEEQSSEDQNANQSNGQGVQAIGETNTGFIGLNSSFLNDPLGFSERVAGQILIAGFDFQSDELGQQSRASSQARIAFAFQPVDWNQWEQPPVDEEIAYEFIVGSAGSAAGLFSIGYVLWALRGGAFFTAVASSMPSWRIVDPTAILSAGRGGASGKSDDDDILG